MSKTGKQTVYVSIGSNIDKKHNVISCIAMLRETFGELKLSPVYESRAVGFDGNNFYNLVASFETAQSPRHVENALKLIEERHGRRRGKNRFESRTLDLDQLLHGDLVINENGVRIPRDDIVQHAFVLRPLADLASRAMHPVLGKTYAGLWSDFDRDATVLKRVSLGDI